MTFFHSLPAATLIMWGVASIIGIFWTVGFVITDLRGGSDNRDAHSRGTDLHHQATELCREAVRRGYLTEDELEAASDNLDDVPRILDQLVTQIELRTGSAKRKEP